MIAGGGVGPFAGGTLAALRPLQPHEQAAAVRVRDIADQPIAALAATVGEIAAAHHPSLSREPGRPVRRFRHPTLPLPPPACPASRAAGRPPSPPSGPAAPTR